MYEDSPFKIDGVPVKPPLLSDLHEWDKVSYAGNDILANFWEFVVVNKDKFFWSYPYITAEELKVIESIIKPKIYNRQNEFMITSWTPDRGFVEVKCYLGTPIKYKVVASDKGVPSILSVEYHWIQKHGINPLEGLGSLFEGSSQGGGN